MTKKITNDVVVKKFLILLGLLIVSPIVLSLAFKAQRIFTQSPKIYIAYALLVIGIFLLLFTVYYGFRTIKTFLDALFNSGV
ncbi:DUF6095 family protein [Tenacibaculum finnmarkense]|uniref:Uncharacterized protein n=1 Tax=Tenacibaculum finnmarkense genomovar finnmarkense TaxID=1458503 RepID=A0AAP1RFT2_9FLAO|nr:DUF6095 family protein [Tenacibaculum finnmarkense]MBE7652887.1 hypothetical protein [Tenacibaculum finnmarkense genomovar finnmarkense]MBE7692437.1 hypothetical protein [Tenacibaculum finnmarkense genomovar finnmarkense]MBE7695188.1 hypothetical protein [Tenacibaculum finnmarkense genomovar finnmarkense]MCD8402599.1 DUF6095 family protein [Tenacibaculum finnmarkense genomovar finnmarkense]MCD8411555.1 DUF6095 family protein [Tenacibaculum finnmarkense genomovar ulcerans]